MFFDEFVEKVINQEYEYDPIFRDYVFRQFVIKTKGKNLDTIRFLQHPLSHTMKKPQRCLYSDNDFYMALDCYSKTYYLCYRSLLMIDIDIGKSGDFESTEEYLVFLEHYCEQHPELLFYVYKSRNGLHCFAVHDTYDFKQESSLQLMLDLHCDFYYVAYTSIRGWSVRLNRKFRDCDQELYTFLQKVGTGNENDYLVKLVNLHIEFSKLCADQETSLMK